MKIGIVARERSGLVAALVGAAREADAIWSADGVDDALERARLRRPDIIVVDASVLSGSATALIALGVPVVLLRSGGGDDGGAVYEAMSEGATYALELPGEGATDEVRAAAMRRVLRASSPPAPTSPPAGDGPIVAIGASTGGPAALRAVLLGIGRPDGCAIVIVQHLEPDYVPGLATWLTHEVGFEVGLSCHGQRADLGRAVIASTADHLIVGSSGSLAHRAPLPDEIHHPSVDALFESLACSGRRGAAALLTGMGRDGAAGLLALRRAGFRTVAQDEASCSVYGMPRAARELDAAEEVLPLDRIGAWIARAVAGSR